MLFCIFYLSSCDNVYHKDVLKNTIDDKNESYDLICSSDEIGSFQGEGFSVFVYQLNSKTINDFLKKDMFIYPKKNKYRKDWFVLNWKKTPIKEDDLSLYKYSISKYLAEDNECLKEIISANLVNIPGNYYSSIYYDDNKQEPLSVDFYILDAKTNKLYYISNKT